MGCLEYILQLESPFLNERLDVRMQKREGSRVTGTSGGFMELPKPEIMISTTCDPTKEILTTSNEKSLSQNRCNEHVGKEGLCLWTLCKTSSNIPFFHPSCIIAEIG